MRGFGRVYKGFINDCDKTVGIKRLKLKPGQGLVTEDLRTEVVLLCQLRHPNLVPLIGYCIDEGENIIVYEFIVNGNLFRKLYYTDHDEHDRLSWKQRLRICIGVPRALHYLHIGVKQTVIHGDVKPANILLNGKWEAKLSDFKSSKMIPSGLSVVLRDTRIPNIAFGVVLLEVLFARKAIIHLRLWRHQLHLASCSQKCKRELRETINHMIDSSRVFQHIHGHCNFLCAK